MDGFGAFKAALLGGIAFFGTSAPPVVGGISPTSFAIAPTVQYHPHSQSAALDGSNKVLSCDDLKGLAYLTSVVPVSGNGIRNPNMAGAVAGTPGTLPTNWNGSMEIGGTYTRTLASDVNQGLSYIDYQINASAPTSGTPVLLFDGTTQVAATASQAWTGSVSLALLSGSLSTGFVSFDLTVREYDAGGVFLRQTLSTIKTGLTTNLQRLSLSVTTGASTAFVAFGIRPNYTGAAAAFNLRIGYPVLEQAASATALSFIGPVQMTDDKGIKFWRFSGAQLLTIASSLVFTKRNCAMLVIGRNHRANTNSAVLGGQGQSTAMLEATWASSRMPVPRVFNKAYTTLDSTYNSLIVGSQLHLIGAASSGTRVIHLMNDKDGSTTQVGTDATCNGGFIGGTSSGANGEWDVYEVAIWNANQTDANIKAQRDLMMANWGLTTITSQIVTMGDSITKGVTGVDSGSVPSVLLSAPGKGYIPSGCRVVNVGSGGQTINDAVAERDSASTFTQFTLAGDAGNNKILFHMGTNDMGAIGGTQTASAVYSEVVALFNSASPSGYLQKGWKIYLMMNTGADDSTKAVQIPALRALYNNSQFLIDTQSNSGGSFDGLVKLIQTHLQTKAPDGTIFDTQADAQSLVYYKDGLHPNETGYAVLVPGGDTPQYGITAALLT